MNCHIFISYESKDNDIVISLAETLKKIGIKVRLNEFQLSSMDSIQKSINQGVSESRYGIVVLGPHFLKKKWPERDLASLLTVDNKYKENILPVCYKIDFEDIKKFFPILAEEKAAAMKDFTGKITEQALIEISHKSDEEFKYLDFLCIVKMIDSELNKKLSFSDNVRNDNLLPKLLPNLLQKYDDFINELVNKFENQVIDNHANPTVFIIQKIREILNAELIYYIRLKYNDYYVVCDNRSSNLNRNIEIEKLDYIINEAISPYFDLNFPCSLKIDNLNVKMLKNDNCVAIPLKGEMENSLLLLFSYSESIFLDDVVGLIFNALHKITNAFGELVHQKLITSAIYDEIKSIYKFVSRDMYDKRYSLFCDSMQNLKMKFQPIVHVSTVPDDIYITSWEALARSDDQNDKQLPSNLFKAAELWGVKFQTELDLCCLRKALESYIPQTRKRSERLPISVNVYPDSILRTVYRKELAKLKMENLLSDDDKLILEISEKTLTTSLEAENKDEPFGELRRTMNRLSNLFGVQFAIDDFGVGYASMSRLNRLLPFYVKIDRDILHYEHKLGKAVIRYLKSLRNITIVGGMKIIVEGLDDKSKISLSELVNELRVRYIQGHLLGKPNFKIFRLTKRKKDEIAKLINLGDFEKNKICSLCGGFIS